ncbi:MAG: hypothetical protein HQ567_30880, partial [Candidatus Nealsonbacteria bacterium]|nr:hypothetical protein [Candidatus Nealsonbacteria bacterium]
MKMRAPNNPPPHPTVGVLAAVGLCLTLIYPAAAQQVDMPPGDFLVATIPEPAPQRVEPAPELPTDPADLPRDFLAVAVPEPDLQDVEPPPELVSVGKVMIWRWALEFVGRSDGQRRLWGREDRSRGKWQ